MEPKTARWWRWTQDGRVACELCPRACVLAVGKRGYCDNRLATSRGMVASTWGMSSGMAVDPIEKKPLYHFLPGTGILSLGGVGCNLGCRFCQNWGISRAAPEDRPGRVLKPEGVAALALELCCQSVAFTYNEPLIWAEYAIDIAAACRARGLRSVAVTNGYVASGPREDFFGAMDAANVDLKAFTDAFYRDHCDARLDDVLETLRAVAASGRTWLEITTLLIPGLNDGDAEIDALAGFVARELGADVPLHLSAFHPDHRMLDRPATPVETLRRCRDRALAQGLHHVYVGNVRDPLGADTLCTACGVPLIRREGFRVLSMHLRDGRCPDCGAPLAGCFPRA